LTGSERAIFLDSACRGDNALRQRIDALLQATPRRTHFSSPRSGRQTLKLPKTVALQPPGDEALGQVIGRYKLREKVGEGGCGVVYVADQEEPVRRRVASGDQAGHGHQAGRRPV